MQRPDAKRAQFLYSHFTTNIPPYCNIDEYLNSVINDIKYHSNQLAAIRQRVVFEKEFVNQIPISDHGHNLLYNHHITNLQEVLDKKHLLKNLSYDDLSVMKKYVESKYINAYRVKLSLDDKNLHATNLLSSIVKYVRLNKLKQNNFSNILYTDSYIETLCVSISPALGWFDWLISNKQEKNTAIKAFNKLEEIFSQYDVAEKNTNLIESKLNVDKEYGWDVFKKFTTDVLKIIEDINPDVIAPDPKKINLIDLDSIIPVSNQQTKTPSKPNEHHHSDIDVDSYIVYIFELLYLSKQGLTAHNIAKQLDLDKDTVNEVLNKNKHMFIKTDGNHWKLNTKNKHNANQDKLKENTESSYIASKSTSQKQQHVEQQIVEQKASTDTLKNRILLLLKLNPNGMTAKEIAFELDCDKTLVNSTLYKYPNLFLQTKYNTWKNASNKPLKTESQQPIINNRCDFDEYQKQLEIKREQDRLRQQEQQKAKEAAKKKLKERREEEYKEIVEEVSKTNVDINGLKGSLRKYQHFGVQFMTKYHNVLIGDEMGLGKTVEALATIVHNANNGGTHFMIVCPLSVLVNWCREAERFTSLQIYKVYKETLGDIELWLQHGGIAIATYESIKKIDVETCYPDMIIVDEAHHIKNPNAQRSMVIKTLCQNAKKIIFLTGTPLENKAKEMADLISLLDNNIGNELISVDGDPEAFKYLMRHIYLRRKREDVLAELPDKVEEKRWLSLGPEEYELYKQQLQDNVHNMQLRQLSWNMDDLSKSCKCTELQSLIDFAVEQERKVLIFSFFKDTLDVIEKAFPDRVVGKLNGSITPIERQRQIDAIAKSPPGSILLLQVVAGGIGLNIQEASVVIFCEPQVKPSMEEQALSRAYRMGQTRTVYVYRLLCKDTIEERMDAILYEKRRIFTEYADESDVALEEIALDNNTLTSLIKQERERHLSPKPIVQDYSIEYQLSMTYDDYVHWLLEKYGPAKFDYFSNEMCRSKSSNITRTKEGLVCHHIDENKAILLSDPDIARANPFEYQKKDRLVYCNLIEHLLLHLKIVNECHKTNPVLGGGGVETIRRQINGYYEDKPCSQSYHTDLYNVIAEKYDDYIKVLKYGIRIYEEIGYFDSLQNFASNWEYKVVDFILKDLQK